MNDMLYFILGVASVLVGFGFYLVILLLACEFGARCGERSAERSFRRKWGK